MIGDGLARLGDGVVAMVGIWVLVGFGDFLGFGVCCWVGTCWRRGMRQEDGEIFAIVCWGEIECGSNEDWCHLEKDFEKIEV